MARRIVYKNNGLPGYGNPLPNYKFVGYDGLTYSQLDSDGNITPIGGVSTSNSIETNPLKYILNGQDKWTDILILDENNYLHNSTPHIGDNNFTKINYNELKVFEQHAITDNHYSISHTSRG